MSEVKTTYLVINTHTGEAEGGFVAEDKTSATLLAFKANPSADMLVAVSLGEDVGNLSAEDAEAHFFKSEDSKMSPNEIPF